jgi:hypothetical protein
MSNATIDKLSNASSSSSSGFCLPSLPHDYLFYRINKNTFSLVTVRAVGFGEVLMLRM